MANKTTRVRITLIALGCCCVAAAAALGVYNDWEARKAADSAQELTNAFTAMLASSSSSGNNSVSASGSPEADAVNAVDPGLEDLTELDAGEIESVEVGGYDVCGSISIPAINIELAVISNWSYKHLKVSACRFMGSPDGQFIVMAHNYDRHFGRLSNLTEGATIVFTAADSAVYVYRVYGTEIWATNQLAEVFKGDWDLSLFTCTYGGTNRVVVRCMLDQG